MGMHFGIVAVKSDVAQLLGAFSTAWPTREPKVGADVSGLSELSAWMQANSREVSARDGSLDDAGTQAFGFWQDGDWTLMLDPGYVQASDGDGLATLSLRFGLTLSFVIETAGGCAFFSAYDQGQRTRRVTSIDGKVTREGAALPQEAGLPGSSFYMEEIERLQGAFGITPLEQLSEDKRIRAMAYVDRTDYAALRREREERRAKAAAAAPSAPMARRPWWRIW